LQKLFNGITGLADRLENWVNDLKSKIKEMIASLRPDLPSEEDLLTIEATDEMQFLVTVASMVPEQLAESFLEKVGDAIISEIQDFIANEDHYYTGELSKSWQYVIDGNRMTVYSDLYYYNSGGKEFLAAANLEFGTDPIPNLPWTPIMLWADARSLPAFPIWRKIKERGVYAYPFKDDIAEDNVFVSLAKDFSGMLAKDWTENLDLDIDL
jgi:hypothetical protein